LNDRADRQVLVLPAMVSVDDLPTGPGGTWEWIHSVAVLGKVGRIDFAGGMVSKDDLLRRAGVLRTFARVLELTAGLVASGAVPGSPLQLAGMVRRSADEPFAGAEELAASHELACAACGLVWQTVGGEAECPACAAALDPTAARDRAIASDSTPVFAPPGAVAEPAPPPPTPDPPGWDPVTGETAPPADDWSMF
jgi:hypothetical protein